MYENRVVSGAIYAEDGDYTNGIMFRELPPLPMMKNDGPTDLPETESCFRKNWSIAFKVLLLGLVMLLSILFIIVCALFSAASVQVEEEKKANKTIPVNGNDPKTIAISGRTDEREEWKKPTAMTKAKDPEPEKYACPVNWNRRGDSCYFFSLVAENWQGAFVGCTKVHSKLLILRNKEEMDSLLPLMTEKAYWLGLKKFDTTWLWFDATPLTFRKWCPKEPNNAGGNETCVEMKSEGWNDVDCNNKMHYICKK